MIRNCSSGLQREEIMGERYMEVVLDRVSWTRSLMPASATG